MHFGHQENKSFLAVKCELYMQGCARHFGIRYPILSVLWTPKYSRMREHYNVLYICNISDYIKNSLLWSRLYCIMFSIMSRHDDVLWKSIVLCPSLSKRII